MRRSGNLRREQVFPAKHAWCAARTLTPFIELENAAQVPTSRFFFRTNDLPETRFGFSIKKALGKAVVRNRIRRRIREIVRRYRQEIPAGWDIVIHPKGAIERVEFAALTTDLLRLIKGIAATPTIPKSQT